MTRSKTTPSPAVSDSPPMSSRFMKNLPRSTREPLIIGPRPAKASMDIISRPLPHPDTCVKPLEQPNKAILRTELPKGNSRMGVKPSSRIDSAPGSLIRMNVHAVAKMPATERKEVSQVKGKDAIKHSPIAEAAPTLPKSMPVSFIRVLPASPDKDRAPPSSWMFPLQHNPNAVSTRRAGIQVTHRKVEAHPRVPDPPGSPQAARAVLVPAPSIRTVVRAPRKSPDKKGEISTEKQARVIKCSPSPNAAIMLCKPMPVSAIRALPALTSSQAIPTQNMPDLVKTCQGVSKMAHQAIEIQARVSLATVKPRLGEVPFVESVECSNECSERAIGPAIERALTSFSAEVEERQQVPTDAIVSIHNGEEEDKCSPHPLAVLTLPASAPVATSSSRMRAVTLLQHPDEWVPPIEGVSRRHEPSIISEDSEANDTRSPDLEAARELPPKSIIEKDFPISPVSFSFGVCAKTQERSVETVLNKELSEGNSLADRVWPIRVMSAWSLHNCGGLSVARCSSSANATLTLHKSTPLRVHPAQASKAGICLFFPVSPMRHKLRNVNTCRVLNETTHRKLEDSVRVSREMPVIGKLECSAECSNVMIGLDVEQILDFFSSEVRERRWRPETAVSSQNEAEENAYAHSCLAAPMLPASTSVTMSVLPTSIVIPYQPSKDQILPIEATSRRGDLNVASKTLGHIVSSVPASIEGEEQLVRATAYIQEHTKRHTFISDEFPHHSSKMLPDKLSGVASKEMEACKQETEEVSEMPESPAIVDNQRSSHEFLIRDGEAVQDSATCFAVLQEASTAEEVDDTAVPSQGSNIVKTTRRACPYTHPYPIQPSCCVELCTPPLYGLFLLPSRTEFLHPPRCFQHCIRQTLLVRDE